MKRAESLTAVALAVGLVGLPCRALAAGASIEEMLDAIGARGGSSRSGAGLKLEGVALGAAARSRLDDEFDAFDRFMDERDYEGAQRRALRAAGEPALAEAAGHLEAAAVLAGELEARRVAIRSSIEATAGRIVTLRTKAGPRKGKVESVTDAGVGLVAKVIINRQVRGENRFTVAWADLAREEEERLAQDWEPEGATGALARAALAISAGDTERAAEELAEAVGHPLVERYHRKVEALGLARAEEDAEGSWAMIERLAARKSLSPEQARSLSDLVAAFREHHGETDFGESKEKALARAEAVALRVLVGQGGVEGSVAFGGHRYKFYRWTAPWADAKRFCERLGGHLVTITSEAEQTFVSKLAPDQTQRFWIGMSDIESEDDWVWVTGEKSRYAHWAAGEPNGTRDQNEVSMDPKTGYGWRSTMKARQFNFFVCEWDPPRRGQPPVKSTSEEPVLVPPGAKKISLYRQDFEEGPGGWKGEIVRDPKAKSAVLEIPQSPDNKYVASHSGRHLGERGFRAGAHARVSFKYRTEGAYSTIMCQNWHTPPESDGSNFYINLPSSTEWARADFPIAWMRKNTERHMDLSRGFWVKSLGVYGGRQGQVGRMFMDEFEIYFIAPESRMPGRRPGPRRGPRPRR